MQSFPKSPLIGGDLETLLKFTSLIEKKGSIIASTLSRGLVSLENGKINDIQSNPRPYFINALETDRSGKIWFGTPSNYNESGLFSAENLARPVKMNVSTGTVLSLKADSDGDLWVGTYEKGAYLFRDSENLEHFTFENTAGGLCSKNIYTIFIDRENVVWFGTDKGVSRYDANSPFNEKISDDANSNFVRTFFQSANGQIYAGTNRGLFVYDEKFNRWQKDKNIPDKVIYALNEDSEGNLLVGSESGLFANFAFGDEKNSDNIRLIQNFRGSFFAAVFGKGLEQIGGENRSFIFSQDSRLKFIKCLYAENDKRLWIGTVDEGVLFFYGEKIIAEPIFEKLRGAGIWAIKGNLEKGIWIATGRGLYLYRNGKLDLIGGEIVAHDLLIDKDKIWTATADGIFQ